MLSRRCMAPEHLAFEVGFCAFVTFFRNLAANTLFLTLVQSLLKCINLTHPATK